MFTSRDIRGIYGKDITDEKLFALSSVLDRKSSQITLGMDYRSQNERILNALIANYKGNVRYLGNIPTPVVAFLTNYLGICITASHNPPEYHGIKFFKPKRILSNTELQNLRDEYSKLLKELKFNGIPSRTRLQIEEDLIQEYLSAIPEIKGGIFDLCGGAACRFADLFPTTLFAKPDPTFQYHSAEPNDKTLETLKLATIRSEKVGYAFDGDADRVVVIAKGKLIPGDVLIAYIAEYYLKRRDKLILSFDCSQEVFNYIRDIGCYPIYAPVGQNLLIREAKKHNAAFIGEYSGHYSFVEFMFYSDPFYFVGQISETKPQELLSFQAQFQNIIIREKIQGKVNYTALQKELERWTEHLVLIDGIKAILEDEDAAILIRHSQSEPITRINVEGPNFQKAKALFKTAKELVRKCTYL